MNLSGLLPTLLRSPALCALLSAVLWGGGDFSGGMAVKAATRPADPQSALTSAFRIILLSHAVSLAILFGLSLRTGTRFPGRTAVLWALLAGLFAALSLAVFYVALSSGAMGASAAIAGLLTAAIPAGVSMLTEGAPRPLTIAGFVVAGVAIWLIGSSPGPGPRSGRPQDPKPGAADPAEPLPVAPAHTHPRKQLTLAIFAGIGFGLYFVAMKFAGGGGLLWPMTLVRMGSVSTCVILILAMQIARPSEVGVAHPTRAAWLPRRALFWALAPAALDTSGNLLFMAATRAGRLDVASVLASLYPASTILLAGMLLGERPTRRQAWGMTVAALGVVLITV